MHSAKLAPIALLAIIAPGCAPSDPAYPSLSLRPAEREGAVRVPSTDGLALVDPAPPAPEVQNRIARQLRAARDAHEQFLAALPSARRVLAAGGTAQVDSRAYAAAQIAVAGLQTISSRTAFAVADLDALLAARSNALLSTEAVAAARDSAAALLRQQTDVLQGLERQLS